jgi:hypothetical protein
MLSVHISELSVPYTVIILHVLVTYIFPLNRIFLHETNTFFCVTVDLSVENCDSSKVTYTGSKVPSGWDSFQQNTGVTKMDSAFKMIRHGEFAYYLKRRGNNIV